MQQQSYYEVYEELELLQSHSTDNFKLYLIRQKSTSAYRMAKKTSLIECSEKYQDQLLNEVKILKELTNPHIIKYYDIFLQLDDFIVILQFCEEGDLEYYVQRKKQKKQPFSEKLILSWVLQILMGLQYLHSKKMIHRLICSHNIYMNHQGDLKLGSFGSAKMLQHTMEKAVTVVGSTCNLSPEIVEGKSYDQKIDIWGLGCLIFQLATHQHPFKINSLPQLYQLIVKVPAQDLPFKYSKYLNPIYKKMMKKNPNYRPSASQLLQQDVFINLMKQYTKKKKIDSLDLREVTPKQLHTHNRTKNGSKFLPPLPNNKIINIPEFKNKTPQSQRKKPERTSRSKEKQPAVPSNTKLPSIYMKTSQSEDQAVNLSPKTNKQQNLPSLQSSSKEKQKDKSSPKMLKNGHTSKGTITVLINQKGEGHKTDSNEIKMKSQNSESSPTGRLTKPNLMQGQYISILCQVKLQMLQKKYSPSMSQIFEQTIEFEDQ